LANVSNPYGFIWHGLYGDAVIPSAGTIQLKIASGDASQYGEGDPVKFLSTGYVTAFTKGTVASQFAGTVKSVSYYSTSQGRRIWRNYWPGSDATGDVSVLVIPASGAIAPRFRVQSAGATAVTASNVWNNVDIASGSSTAGTVTGGFYRSAATIDTVANIGTTATLPFRIVGLWSDIAAPGTPGTDNTTAYNWVLVEANNIQATGI
jgi:hypothetical protein